MARARTLVGLDVTARRANKPESPPPEPIKARARWVVSGWGLTSVGTYQM